MEGNELFGAIRKTPREKRVAPWVYYLMVNWVVVVADMSVEVSGLVSCRLQ